jgi:hypothetical protein
MPPGTTQAFQVWMRQVCDNLNECLTTIKDLPSYANNAAAAADLDEGRMYYDTTSGSVEIVT